MGNKSCSRTSKTLSLLLASLINFLFAGIMHRLEENRVAKLCCLVVISCASHAAQCQPLASDDPSQRLVASIVNARKVVLSDSDEVLASTTDALSIAITYHSEVEANPIPRENDKIRIWLPPEDRRFLIELLDEAGKSIPVTLHGREALKGIKNFSINNSSVKYYSLWRDAGERYPLPQISSVFAIPSPGRYQLKTAIILEAPKTVGWVKVQAPPVYIRHEMPDDLPLFGPVSGRSVDAVWLFVLAVVLGFCAFLFMRRLKRQKP